MSKQIRVSDEAYAVIEREAKRNHRSVIADQVDAMVLPPIKMVYDPNSRELLDRPIGSSLLETVDEPSVAEKTANMKPEGNDTIGELEENVKRLRL